MKKFLGFLLMFLVSNVFAVTVADAGEDKTFCVSEHFYVNGSEPGIGETAYWIDLDGLVMAPYDTLWGSQIEKAGAYPGVYRYKYVITNGIEESVDVLEIIIKDVPDVTEITATLTDGCEGEEVTANVEPVLGADGYVWSITKGGTIYPSSDTSTMVVLSSDGTVSAEVEVVVMNSCGSSAPIVASNNIKRKPHETPVIEGDVVVCSVKKSSYTHQSQTTNETTWRWEWDGIDRGTESVLTLMPSDFGGGIGELKLISQNECGEGAAALLRIDIVFPAAPRVKVNFAGNIDGNETCIEDSVEVEIDLNYSNGYNQALYEYFVNSTSQGEATGDKRITISKGSWRDGDSITVQMIPDTIWGCYTKSLATSSPITIVAKDEALCGPLNLEDDKNTGIVFYPNPASQSIQLSNEFEASTINIYSLEGQLEIQETNVLEVNIEDLESGMHIIQVENEGQLYTSKLIIE